MTLACREEEEDSGGGGGGGELTMSLGRSHPHDDQPFLRNEVRKTTHVGTTRT